MKSAFIAITLLVLDVKVPTAQELGGASLMRALLRQWPIYFAFVTSFLTILIMWVNHHNLMSLIKRTDHVFLMLNGLLLMGVSIVLGFEQFQLFPAKSPNARRGVFDRRQPGASQATTRLSAAVLIQFKLL